MVMQPGQPEYRALVRAHRNVQADQCSAIAAENDRELTQARMHLAAIEARLRERGSTELAAQLVREAEAGAALVAVLTSPQQDSPVSGREELDEALASYALLRREVGDLAEHPQAG
ncbi:hypothetical protein [Pseudonocardia sp. WMMC193]|uniref:hypothetical protein n=1 Tax=Pseudonocardia sp. WMMC193 TaxID=2911965 RepID=UPI001F1C4E0B|nr:hypothetical protein [Pseudonocardia sp. WMMC193]MCF7547347.1 hypothetical protein [Pseudonocardia sp. WMMC193]